MALVIIVDVKFDVLSALHVLLHGVSCSLQAVVLFLFLPFFFVWLQGIGLGSSLVFLFILDVYSIVVTVI